MKTSFVIAFSSVALVCGIATPAHAQGFLSGTVGAAGSGLAPNVAPTYGGQAGYWSEGALGFEADYEYSARIRGGGKGDNERTIMFDVLIGPRVAEDDWRPYAAAGVGLVGAVAQFSDIFTAKTEDKSQFGMNAGGGIMRFFNAHWGVRVDARYLFVFEKPSGENDRQHFIRAGAGLALRF